MSDEERIPGFDNGIYDVRVDDLRTVCRSGDRFMLVVEFSVMPSMFKRVWVASLDMRFFHFQVVPFTNAVGMMSPSRSIYSELDMAVYLQSQAKDVIGKRLYLSVRTVTNKRNGQEFRLHEWKRSEP